MPAVSFIFPHQLFKDHPALEKGRTVYLIEEWLFFRQYDFHQQKLVLHRASMQFYKEWLESRGYDVIYISSLEPEADCRKLISKEFRRSVDVIHLADPVDDWLLRRLKRATASVGIALHVHHTPGFINQLKDVKTWFDNRKTYFQADFYTWQRKTRKILLAPDGSPMGGKWSFDADNRSRLPKTHPVPSTALPPTNKFLAEASIYVRENFGKNYGNATAPPLFAVTFDDAAAWMQDFFQQRFAAFGKFEDAMVSGQSVLFHSVLTPMLNTGLLTPVQVLQHALEAAPRFAVPLNSLEGFVRQVMGWREFVRIVYEREGVKQRTRNYWNFKRKIPPEFWTGETGIAPVDTTIKKVLKTGYCHHIERLMVLGNFMLLCEFDPGEVYRWFMELFIDAYDWVMVPNVYGMSQFADGGMMTTKPYISSSNYILKMSDYKKGPWCETWDALFWRFMHVHRDFFGKNPRLGMLLNTFDKMAAEKRGHLLATAENFLARFDT